VCGGFVEDAVDAVREFALADRKDAASGGDASLAEEDAAVVEGGFWVEDGEDEFGGEFAIDLDAGFDELVEVHGALECEESAEAFGGEL
jgi:hypothetical protein